tara:strand:+ start:264 stop:578 length:315 start_codon:yes stop_codon:yes gene_type:complete
MTKQYGQMLETLAGAGFQLRGCYVHKEDFLFGRRLVETVHVEAPVVLIAEQLRGYQGGELEGDVLRYEARGIRRSDIDGDTFLNHVLEFKGLPTRSARDCVVDF